MKDPENFISRWSRRKREPTDESERPEAAPRETDDKNLEAQVPENVPERPEPADESKPEAEPAFDLSKLPSIESITAETDIRAFLAPGVPAELTRAALRRVWVIDPKIRDFIEIAENQWDFTAPGVPGFDLSPPIGEIKQMLAQILPKSAEPESPHEEKKESSQSDVASLESGHHRIVTEAPEGDRGSRNPEQQEIVQQSSTISGDNSETSDAATQKVSALQDERPVPKRGHGGAMPR
jgi:hypothetical protein